MPLFPSSPPEAAMLLVLLPRAKDGEDPAALAAISALQQLGPAVRVLRIDEATHPAVVHSFRLATLPAWVLVRRGVELGRQPGLPTVEMVASLLPSQGPATVLMPGVDINQAAL